MIAATLPSARLAWLGAAFAAGSLALLAFPNTGWLLLTANLTLVLFAAFDWLITPGPRIVGIERTGPQRLGVLSRGTITVTATNRGRQRLRLRVRPILPAALRPESAEAFLRVEPDGVASAEIGIHPAARGRFAFGDVHFRYLSALGLWERGGIAKLPAELKIYPNVDGYDRYQLLARVDRLAALGIRRLRVRGSSWEFESLKQFADGDDLRLMDWKATARRNKLTVRNQQAERQQTLLILLDCGRLMTAEEDGVSKVDRAVGSALLLAQVALARGDRVGLLTFSGKVHTWLPPAARPGHARLIGDALFDLQPDFSESDHPRALRTVALKHNKRSLIAVLTDFVDAETGGDMLAAVRHAARRHVVLFCALQDPFIERTARLEPTDETEGFTKTVALGLIRDRHEVLSTLRRLGVQALDAPPDKLTPRLLNKYLEISLRGLV